MAEDSLKWYALRIFWNRGEQVKEMLERRGVEYYAQKILPSYMFVHTDKATILRIRADENDWGFRRLYIYSEGQNKEPVVVPDKEMEIFRIITSAADTGLEFLGEDATVYKKGDRVRVKEGPFKGAEGYIIRLRKDRRLVVTITGVAAIATSYIPPALLEKVESAE